MMYWRYFPEKQMIMVRKWIVDDMPPKKVVAVALSALDKEKVVWVSSISKKDVLSKNVHCLLVSAILKPVFCQSKRCGYGGFLCQPL